MAIETFDDDIWYFAYGSNMNWDQKEDRTGAIREARIARLLGYRFAFNKRGKDAGQVYANVMNDEEAVTWGVIYRCRPAAIELLDRHEGVRIGHYRRTTMAVLVGEEEVEAVVYVAEPKYIVEDSKPSDDYLGRILAGARLHELPDEYVRRIETIAGR